MMGNYTSGMLVTFFFLEKHNTKLDAQEHVHTLIHINARAHTHTHTTPMSTFKRLNRRVLRLTKSPHAARYRRERHLQLKEYFTFMRHQWAKPRV